MAELNTPDGIVLSNSGDIYIGDVGHYRVRLVTKHPVAINNIVSQEQIVTVFPNPANQAVTIEAYPKSNYSIIITDVLGRLIYKDSFTDKIQIPVHWQPGVYSVQVISENGYKEVQKLIVQ